MRVSLFLLGVAGFVLYRQKQNREQETEYAMLYADGIAMGDINKQHEVNAIKAGINAQTGSWQEVMSPR